MGLLGVPILAGSQIWFQSFEDFPTSRQNLPGAAGYSGINVMGGGGGPTEPNILHPKKYMDLVLCTQKNTRLEILDPKKYMTFIPFRILRELWLELRKNY